MNNLEQLTADRGQCNHLTMLGILPIAFLWWLEVEKDQYNAEEIKNNIQRFEVCPVMNPEPGPDCLPAWTKAEIDAMIGPEVGPKPDLFTREQLGNYQLLKRPEYYPVFTIDKMIYYENGAQASAFALIYLIEEGKVTAKEANDRYSKIFNPFK